MSPTVELSAGAIEYRDTGGAGPVLVLLHGVLMDSGQWREVVPHLAPDYRCILPTLPLGGHRLPMRADADLSLAGQARLVAEFLEALDLREATLAFNDWAAPQILVADDLTARIGGMVLVACETAGNYPPGLPGKNLALTGAIPGGLRLGLASMRLRLLRRTPVTFGWMAKHGVPDDLIEGWLSGPWSDAEVLRDVRRYIRGTREGRRRLVAATRQLERFDRPVTVIWAAEDRVMPMREGEALAAAFPDSRLEIVEDSYVLVPLDQPRRLAELIREHMRRSRA
ncbi:MAG TPA: alpha/beta hydrolase [Thermoleophilaceae bacterium]|nr:alpha/beta hydrolase [Thermoleophilaceae bacterium]